MRTRWPLIGSRRARRLSAGGSTWRRSAWRRAPTATYRSAARVKSARSYSSWRRRSVATRSIGWRAWARTLCLRRSRRCVHARRRCWRTSLARFLFWRWLSARSSGLRATWMMTCPRTCRRMSIFTPRSSGPWQRSPARPWRARSARRFSGRTTASCRTWLSCWASRRRVWSRTSFS